MKFEESMLNFEFLPPATGPCPENEKFEMKNCSIKLKIVLSPSILTHRVVVLWAYQG